jgi:hypothetical protein
MELRGIARWPYRPAKFRRTVTGAAIACLLALPVARAEEDRTVVAKAEAHLILDMPGLAQSREIFQTLGWDANYSRRVFFAAQVARAGDYPRAQAYYLELAPNRLAVAQNDVTESWVKKLFPFLADKQITISGGAPPRRSDDFRTLRFAVDRADCLAFSIMLSGLAPGRSDGNVSGTSGQVLGFYCSAPGAALAESDIADILGGWRTLGPSHELLVDGRLYARH